MMLMKTAHLKTLPKGVLWRKVPMSERMVSTYHAHLLSMLRACELGLQATLPTPQQNPGGHVDENAVECGDDCMWRAVAIRIKY